MRTKLIVHPFQRLSREVGIWSRLSSAPNIARFIGYVVEESEGVVHASLVSQWYENGDVVKYVVNHPDADRGKLVSLLIPLRFPKSSSINQQCAGVAYGLRYLHESRPPIVHGDLKPVSHFANWQHKCLIIQLLSL